MLLIEKLNVMSNKSQLIDIFNENQK